MRRSAKEILFAGLRMGREISAKPKRVSRSTLKFESVDEMPAATSTSSIDSLVSRSPAPTARRAWPPGRRKRGPSPFTSTERKGFGWRPDRKRVVQGKRVSGSVDLGGGCVLHKQTKKKKNIK